MPVHVRVAASLSHISKTYKTFFFLCQAGEIREEGLRGGKKEWEKGRQVKSCHAIFTDDNYKKFYSIWTVLSTFFLLNMGQRGGERGDEEEGRRGWVGTGSWWCDGVGEIGGQVRRCYGNRLIGKNVSSCGARRGREKESEKWAPLKCHKSAGLLLMHEPH